MQKLFYSISISFAFLVVLFITPQQILASVGTVDLRSTNSQDYRCFASSLIMPNARYDVAINCVNLIFPVNPQQVSTYIVWATPLAGRNPVRLGDLQKGFVRFEVKDPFSALFVTSESNPNPRAPSANIVMNGGIEPIRFLERETSPTPIPEVQEQEQNGEEQPTETKVLTTREKLLLALRRAGIAAVIALVAIVGLIFVVTRSRG